MQMLKLCAALMIAGALAACSSSSSTPTTPAPTIDVFTGSWRSTATAGACTGMSWSITSVSVTAATIGYTATCAGVPVTGTANGTLNGSTLNWTTTGTAANACPFALSGTATPDTSGNLAVTYTGTMCGLPITGSDVMHR
jgi:hypothetical protein